MAFCLSFPKWCNTYTLAEKIKALEHQTFSTHFTSKFMLFWITQKLTFFTHPNIKIGKNGNAPIHRRGFHVFFQKFMTLIHTSQTGYYGFSLFPLIEWNLVFSWVADGDMTSLFHFTIYQIYEKLALKPIIQSLVKLKSLLYQSPILYSWCRIQQVYWTI